MDAKPQRHHAIPALMPTMAERNGVFSNSVLDPLTGAPFSGGLIPQSRISPQARALLNLYPLPNFTGSSRYNYQIPMVSPTHQDALQSRFNKTLGRKDQIFGQFAFQSTRTDTPNLFGFLDTTDMLGINTRVNWSHRFSQRAVPESRISVQPVRDRATPYFENRENVSGKAGIQGNNQDPVNWGPPSLSFASGIAGLTDAQSHLSIAIRPARCLLPCCGITARHNVTFGGDFRRQQFNYPVAAGSARHVHFHRRGDRLRFRGFSAGHSRHQLHRLRQRRQIFPRNPSTTPTSPTIGGSVRSSR